MPHNLHETSLPGQSARIAAKHAADRGLATSLSPAPLNTPHSIPAAGVDTPRPASIQTKQLDIFIGLLGIWNILVPQHYPHRTFKAQSRRDPAINHRYAHRKLLLGLFLPYGPSGRQITACGGKRFEGVANFSDYSEHFVSTASACPAPCACLCREDDPP